MKKLRKIGAIVLAVMMVAVMGLALADDADNSYSGSGNTIATGVAGTTSIPLKKSIVFFNKNGSTVYEPNLTYTYTVAPHDPNGATVTDDGSLNQNTPVTVTVNQGPSGGVYFDGTDNEIAFSSSNTAVAALSTGTEVEHSTNLSVDLTKFTRAGIFRYIITESTTASQKNAVGVVQGSTFNNTRYLDVYIRNGDSGLELYGAVIFKTAETASGSEGTDDIDTDFEKTTGFAPGTDATSGATDYSSETACDTYTTYDFSVKKEVSGGLADKTNEFPFYVNVTNTISGAKYTFFDDPGTGTGTAETIPSSASIAKGTNESSSALTLKHGDYIKFVGVPSSTSAALSIVITEWNNTPDSYTPSVEATNGTPAMVIGTLMATGGSDSVSTFDLKTNDDADQIITVTNTLAEISPTGYVTRFAPYALILIGGIALLIISRKHKKHTDEE